jgi:hypothetical protein
MCSGFGTDTAIIYDPALNTWSVAAPMPTARQAHAVVLLADGRVLVAGGLTTAFVSLATADIYDPVTNTWSSTANTMSGPRFNSPGIRLPNGKVLLTGGHPSVPILSDLATTEIYDPGTNMWSPGPSLILARSSHSQVVMPNATQWTVIVAGGASLSIGFPFVTDTVEFLWLP